MKESYREGVANHPDPESCEGGRKTALEALTGAQIGRVIELRNLAVEGADAVRRAEGNTAGDDSARSLLALAEAQLRRTGVEEPGHVWKPGALWARENRETPLPPVAVAVAGRWEKAMSSKSHMHGSGESNSGVVCAEQRVAQEG